MNEKFNGLSLEKQNAILNAGYKVFAQNSYTKASTADIAQECNVSKALLFHYFVNKKELYTYLLENALKLTEEAKISHKVYETDDFFENLKRGLYAKCEVIRKYPYLDMFSMNAFYEEDPEIKRIVQEKVKNAEEITFNTLLPAIKRSQFRKDLSFETVYKSIIYASEGIVSSWYRNPEMNADDFEKEYLGMIEHWKLVYGRNQKEKGNNMNEKIYETTSGEIHYFTNEIDPDKITLIFLPGLTADHRLFDKQIEYFTDKTNILTWDPPCHAASRPFMKNFSLEQKAVWLKEIIDREGIKFPVIAGQSMGGYVGQAFEQKFPGVLKGFVSIDSAPLKKSYTSDFDLWFLKHCEGVYMLYPWKSLIKAGGEGCSTTEYGIKLMSSMIASYNHREYAALTGYGYKLVAEAIERDLPYQITCPALLICGKNDRAGKTVDYNKKWHVYSGINIKWIEGAGHNSNTDRPEEINRIIMEFISSLGK